MLRCMAEILRQVDNGKVYSSPFQPEFCDWAFPYSRIQDRFNPAHQCTPGAVSAAESPVPDYPAIDVMMTHGPPLGVLDATTRGEHVGCAHLLRAAQRCKPRLHCFGHIHEGWGAQRIRWAEDPEAHTGFEGHVQSVNAITVDKDEIARERAAWIDGTSTSLELGRETLMVNASIMTFTYKPWNGAWLVDLDLGKAS